MAEFPELGRHCALRACNRLDFTPVQCAHCALYHCLAHRFEHGCRRPEATDDDSRREAGQPPPPPSPHYACEFADCDADELTQIECSLCAKNFCMRHRQCESHSCASLAAHKTTKRASPRPTTRIATADNTRRRPLSASEKARMDRVALMRAKLTNKAQLAIPAEERVCLFVVVERRPMGASATPTTMAGAGAAAGERFVVIVSAKWTIGRAVEHIRKELGLTETGKWRMYRAPREPNDAPLLYSDAVAARLVDQSEVIVVGEGQ